LAKDGRLKFIEICQIDAAARFNAGPSTTTSHDGSNAEKVWSPLVSSGFTYSFWLRVSGAFVESATGSLFLLDLSCSSGPFLSFWYDLQYQQICVLSSSSRSEPSKFPQIRITPDVWHHIVLTYQPTKRPMLGRRSIVNCFVDGCPLSEDTKVESIYLPPTASVHIGAPNPKLAASGIVRGLLPCWELGPFFMTATVMSSQEATAIYAAGPEFDGLFWGSCSQRKSFTASATTLFSMLAASGEEVSVAVALRKRQVPEAESSGTFMREKGFHDDSLPSFGLQCFVNPDDVIFGFRPSAWSAQNTRDPSSHHSLIAKKLINIARINEFGNSSEEGTLYGSRSIIIPQSFSGNLYWVGGPNLLLPLVNAAETAGSLSLALRLIRVSSKCHPPNLESLQAGGGYRILGLLLRQKRIMDIAVLDQCFAFAVSGFTPKPNINVAAESPDWVFADLDAMKYLLLNHQIWDLRRGGPDLPMRFISFLNGLLSQENIHAAFNARRLHVLGIVQWVLHLMLEAAELYDSEEAFDDEELIPGQMPIGTKGPPSRQTPASTSSRWRVSPPLVAAVAAGNDPDNELLRGCKTLLRRILTHMLTPDDLEATAGATMYTLSISDTFVDNGEGRLPAGPVARIYLLRLLEELVVDGVNEIVTTSKEALLAGSVESEAIRPSLHPHAGGAIMKDQSNATASLMSRKKKLPPPQDISLDDPSFQQLSHQQAQAFLCIFSGILTPTWFACILEGCREEASASAALRVMILLLQSSPTFSTSFEQAGGFAPLVLSLPKYSICPSIIMSMLSQLLHAPILYLPVLQNLDAAQLCEVFDAESDSNELFLTDSNQGGLHTLLDPSCGIFALLSECLGRNIQLASVPDETGAIAKKTNEAVLKLLGHRHTFSSSFQEFCRTRDFLEPLSQSLCLIHEEKEFLIAKQRRQRVAELGLDAGEWNEDVTDQRGANQNFMIWPNDLGAEYNPPTHNRNTLPSTRHPQSLKDANTKETPTERLVGKNIESEMIGLSMVQLLRHIISHAVLSRPLAATLMYALFHSFPIHATPEQVEVFDLVLIEHSKSVVEDALQRGEPFALANCIGVSSVFLDCSLAGFFSSEPVLETVQVILGTLQCLASHNSYASRVLGLVDQNMLIAEAAHIARLTCLTALNRSRPLGPYSSGDDDLKIAVLEAMSKHIRFLLLAPNVGTGNQKLTSVLGGSPQSIYTYNPPVPGHRSYSLWQSASLARCPSAPAIASFPDLRILDQPDNAFVTALLSELYLFLLDRDDIRDKAVTLVVMLLQHRRNVVCELLVAELACGDGRIETVDLMRGGGFGALLVQFAAADIAGNVGSAPSRDSSRTSESGSRYASFFEWLERNEGQVAAIFHGIRSQACRQGYDVVGSTLNPIEVIEKEQKVMLLKLTTQDTADRTICGVLERADLGQRIHDEVAESHSLWKRQGFDDFAYGTTQWKTLLRQLKGSRSVWERDYDFTKVSVYSRNKLLLQTLQNKSTENDELKAKAQDMQQRWKLDLTEGYERQRIRLLPNYEFQSLYNIEDQGEQSFASENAGAESRLSFSVAPIIVNSDDVSDTTALLKEIHIKRKANIYEEDEFDEILNERSADNSGRGDQAETVVVHDSSLPDQQIVDGDIARAEESALEDIDIQGDGVPKPRVDGISASSYDLITGLLEPGDWPEKSYNVQRCTGLEVRTALLLFCPKALYVIDGFEKTEGDGLEGKINCVEMSTTSFTVRLRSKNDNVPTMDSEEETQNNKGSTGSSKAHDSRFNGGDKNGRANAKVPDGEKGYQHRSHRVLFKDLYSVYKRRYQLQPIALEFYDVHRKGIFVAFQSSNEREEILTKVLSSPLPNSIFSANSGGNVINYDRFMASLRGKITAEWVNGRMSNFEFIMHLNSFAGRSYNDLTQYPVFPWLLSDYESEEIDLSDPKVYRDLTKPMGAQGAERAIKFQETFKELEENNHENPDEFPPYHYATHYSTAGYVLYYLLRLEPFSRLAITLQGGHFDLPDRLFKSISGSWSSASRDNMQDVRELIPEFFFLPEFLVNSNLFDFGNTQKGEVVDDVLLPPWAKGDPKRFIRIHRQALESNHVSRNLHHWIDLVFGYKQRGREAVNAQNVFFHITYEGAVDIDIHHFGQTPNVYSKECS